MIYLFLIARMCILHQEEKKIMNVMERQRRRTIVLKSVGQVLKKDAFLALVLLPEKCRPVVRVLFI
jgi:hypothetical protein